MTDPQHPYSDTAVANGLGFVSGSLPLAEDGSVVPRGRAAMDAVMAQLEQRMATVGVAELSRGAVVEIDAVAQVR